MTTLLTGGGTRGREALDDDVDLARDRALVTRAQDGDRSAFDDLYMRYYRRLYRFCLRRLHDSHEAEDVAQEAFARAWRALPTFGGDRRFYPWLSVIASHLCTDVLRRRNRSTPVAEFHQTNVASTEDGGEELMLAAVDSDLVARAFTRLSDRHQRILHLREGSGWSYQRIADHEGVGITAVETLLWRARQALKREFASLAGAESRMAGWAAGLLSLASLRRLLNSPVRALRRASAVSAKSVAVAAGSAAAVGAVVIGATMSGPSSVVPTTSGSTVQLQGGSTPQAPVPVPSDVGSAAGGSSSTSTGASGGTQVPSSPVQTPTSPLPGLPSPTGQLPQVGDTLNGVTSTVGSGLGTVSSTLDSGAQTIGGALDGTSPGTGSLVTQPVAGVSSLLQNVSGALGSS